MRTGSRYEILPFGAGPAEAADLPEPAAITVTCSPKHGLDRTIEIAEGLRRHGHTVIPHVPARMVRDQEHLDLVLRRAAEAGMDEIFMVGGDASEPHGPFESAVELLSVVHDHPLRPRRIGIGAYPEGHPLIPDETLMRALESKSGLADYVVTQMCFDAKLLLNWLQTERDRGLELPVYIGIPGAVDRRKLMEISMRVGVGQSVSFLRKQRGLRRLFSSPKNSMQVLYGTLAPRIGDPRYGIAGFHWYTFNRLLETWAWEHGQGDHLPRPDENVA
jgi:methylenetetrahydrofolate reductase (NADPH)